MKEIDMTEIVDKLSESGAVALQKYSDWYFYAAASYILFGIAVFVAAIHFRKKIVEHVGIEFGYTAIAIMLVTGFCMVVTNVPDMLNPDGIALHRLILDIRGE